MPKPIACLIPKPVKSPKEAKLYRSIRDTLIAAHCDADRPAHRCLGQISITREAIILQCRRCGDSKNLIPEE